jgi:hypothetical protein
LPLDLLIQGLLPPAAPSFRLPQLERWLARADLARDPAPDAETWLARRFGLAEAPVAPVTLAADDAPAEGAWLRADPVYARAERDTMVLHDATVLEVTSAEADALIAALQGHFAGDGLEFRAPFPDRWYVRVPEGELPRTTPLARALGRDTFGLLPEGTGRINWLSTITEAQMLLASHPVNLAREAARRPPVNSVWFWGGGHVPRVEAPPYASVHSDDPFARGLALLGAMAPHLPPARLRDLAADPGESTLVTLAPVRQLDREHAWKGLASLLDLEWAGSFADALARFGTVRLVLPTGSDTLVATLEPGARWRWWRRARALSTHA